MEPREEAAWYEARNSVVRFIRRMADEDPQLGQAMLADLLADVPSSALPRDHHLLERLRETARRFAASTGRRLSAIAAALGYVQGPSLDGSLDRAGELAALRRPAERPGQCLNTDSYTTLEELVPPYLRLLRNNQCYNATECAWMAQHERAIGTNEVMTPEEKRCLSQFANTLSVQNCEATVAVTPPSVEAHRGSASDRHTAAEAGTTGGPIRRGRRRAPRNHEAPRRSSGLRRLSA